MLGPLTEEGTREISLVPLEELVKLLTQRHRLYRICSLQQSTTRGITTYPAALRHCKTQFHTIKPFCTVLVKKTQEKTVVVEYFKADMVF